MTEEVMSSMREDIAIIKNAISPMQEYEKRQTAILEVLAANKVEHSNFQHDIDIVRDRTHKLGNDVVEMAIVREKQSRLEMRADDIEQRVESIEVSMPMVKLSSGWVFKFTLAVAGILGTVAVGVIIRAFMQ